MHLNTLELSDYRNYDRAVAEFPAGITVISGQNAQGKTNLLESVFLCCAGRSHRSSKENEMIRLDRAFSYVKASFDRGGVAHDISITLRREGRKRILFDGANVPRTADFVGQMQSVLFAPENILIVKDAPVRRRAYMDVALSQVYKWYLRALLDYNRALSERNTLLRSDVSGAAWSTLEVYEQQLAALGARIMQTRREFCLAAGEGAAAIQRRISGGADELTLTYAPNIECAAGEEEPALLEKFIQTRERDLLRRTTTVGPHRDDITLLVNGLEARLYGSQGQQRTAALSIKMAELDFMKRCTGHRPILLLDDVFGELDAARREQLLTAVGDCQTILTCTNVETLPIDRSRTDAVYHVEKGEIILI